MRGRASRRELGSAFLAFLGVLVATLLADELLLDDNSSLATIEAVFFPFQIVFLPVSAAFVMTLVRRLHDTGRPARRLLLALIPFGAILLAMWAMEKGDPAKNTYGDPPGPRTAE